MVMREKVGGESLRGPWGEGEFRLSNWIDSCHFNLHSF